MNYQIIPGILRSDQASFEKDLVIAEQLAAPMIQIDVIDGIFAPMQTVDYEILHRQKLNRPCEIDLMVIEPEKLFQHYTFSGVAQIIFHIEATFDAQALVDAIHAKGLRCAVAISPETRFIAIENIKYIDQVTVMTVHPGKQGQPFVPQALDHVKHARQEFPDIDIEVDGGITLETLPLALSAGANKFVAGSYILWSDDPRGHYQQLANLLPQ